jgi:hypothetical protein
LTARQAEPRPSTSAIAAKMKNRLRKGMRSKTC